MRENNKIRITTDVTEIDPVTVHRFLTNSYWAEGRSEEEVIFSMKNSLCFGLLLEEKLIGFARVVTDKIFFAYLMDVFILPEYRGKGYGKMFMEHIFYNSELKKVQRWMLATRDAHALYEKYGFKKLEGTDKYMAMDNG
jgi:GNAT superfamily N-acetyltransferase